MPTSYDEQIKTMEIQYTLEAQKSALLKVDLECLRLKQKIEEYETTRTSLNEQIKISEEKLLAMKGGGKNG